MLVSASIIVKNEEGVIERCLDSVSQFADEIVVIDTGSTDRTKEIAGRHPKVRLFDSEYFNKDTHFSDFRFGVAKNEGIRRCQGKFICWWDADDFVDKDNAAKIRSIAENEDANCLFSFTVEYGPLRFEHCRMFRNGIGILFDEDHSCHEFLNTLGYPNIARREIVILHLPGPKLVSSGERNIAIMEKDHYKRGMNDQRTLFYLASAYREAGRDADAVKFYDKYLEVSGWAEERFFARYFKAQVLVRMNRIDDARREALLSLTEDFRFAEPYCLLGDIAFQKGDLERAQAWFQMAVATPFPEDAKLFVARPLYSAYPSARIMDCHKGLIGRNSVEEKQNGRPTFSYISNALEVIGVYRLPDSRDEMIVAASVLAAIARARNKIFEVVVADGKVKNLICQVDGLVEAEDGANAVILNVPAALNGRSREEWYFRSVGHVPLNWEPSISDSREIQAELRRAFDAD